MKKGKILILSVLLLMVCGCDVEYSINIRGNKVSEKAIFPNNGNYTYDNLQYNIYYDVNAGKKYDAKITKNKIILSNKKSDFKTFSANNKYSFCFDKIDSVDTKEYYTLGTSEGFKCMRYDDTPIDSVTVVLKTFNKVIEHNADDTRFGKYIWYFDNYNYKNKRVYFSVKKSDYLWYYRYRGLILGLSGVLVLVIIASIIMKIFKDKSNKENKI